LKTKVNVISQAEWDEIRVIADKCPLTDGQAVYEAMSLLHLLDEEVEMFHHWYNKARVHQK
jgi:hypothetical protein